MLDRLLEGRIDYIVAFAPWDNPYEGERAASRETCGDTQAQIDFCLCCPLLAANCDRCDGCGNIPARKSAGRPSRCDSIDRERMAQLVRAEMTNRAIADELGVSLSTVKNYKRFMAATM